MAARALIGEQCRGDPDSFLYPGPPKEHRKAICCRLGCRSCRPQYEDCVRGACPAAARDRPRSTRAHHAHPPLAAHKPSECGRSQQIYLIAAAAVQMGAQRFLFGDVRAIDWRGTGHPPQPLAR